MSTDTQRSADYDEALTALTEAEHTFWAASIAEAERMMPSGVQALIFRVNDTPRLAFDAYLDEGGTEYDGEEIDNIADLDLFDALDTLAGLLPVYDAEDASTWLIGYGERFIISRHD